MHRQHFICLAMTIIAKCLLALPSEHSVRDLSDYYDDEWADNEITLNTDSNPNNVAPVQDALPALYCQFEHPLTCCNGGIIDARALGIKYDNVYRGCGQSEFVPSILTWHHPIHIHTNQRHIAETCF